MRILHVCVVAVLVLAAADVYKIKFESTMQAERVSKLRGEIRREHDAIAALRAEWTELDRPGRLQALAQRHLPLRPIEITQYDKFDHLPERPSAIVPQGPSDPIGTMIDSAADPDSITGSIPTQPNRR
ncbi:MAG TPA: hypothetical protein VHN11_08725 [Xanthobacteraceae bacterium]|nr:hypothetical protein [Xanthobacteraceae bacterium]